MEGTDATFLPVTAAGLENRLSPPSSKSDRAWGGLEGPPDDAEEAWVFLAAAGWGPRQQTNSAGLDGERHGGVDDGDQEVLADLRRNLERHRHRRGGRAQDRVEGTRRVGGGHDQDL